MAVTVSNRKNTSFVLHVSAANSGNVIVSGNSTTTNVAGTTTCIAQGNEVMTGAYITQAVWGSDGAGSIQVLRGGTLVAVYDSTGQKDYAGCGIPLNVNPTGNVVVNFVGSSNAYCILELQKLGTTSEYYS